MKNFERRFARASVILLVLSILWFGKENKSLFPDSMFYPLHYFLDNKTMDYIGSFAIILTPVFAITGAYYACNFRNQNKQWPLKVSIFTLALLPFAFYGCFLLLWL